MLDLNNQCCSQFMLNKEDHNTSLNLNAKKSNVLICGGLWSKPWMILHQNVGAYSGVHFSIAGLYFLLLAKYFTFWNNIHF